MLNEQLSAWCDGELSSEEAEASKLVYPRTPEQRAACELSWLIGDALRGEAPLSGDFTSKVMQALAAEPVVLAPVARAPQARPRQSSHWMAMAAALSGVVVAGWMVASMWSRPAMQTGPVVAQALAPVAAVSAVQVASNPLSVTGKTQALPANASYLMAHQASSVGAPMADVAHFIRTVSDDQQGVGQ